MESLQCDTDDEDPIKLIDFEQKRITVNRTLAQECIELSDSDVEVVSVPPPRAAKSANPEKITKVASKTVGSSLPQTFFDKFRNVKLLHKCLPLRVKVIDCGKHSWYYRKKYKNIKINVNNRPVKVNTENSSKSALDEGAMKHKIHPVDVESYLKSPIGDNIKAALLKKNNDKSKNTLCSEKKPQSQNIDYKKNKGLIGLKILYEVNKVDTNSINKIGVKIKEAKTPAPQCNTRTKEYKPNQNEIHNDSQEKDSKINEVDSNRNMQNSVISKSPKNREKKLSQEMTKKSPAKVDNYCSQKSNKLKNESSKFKGTSKAAEEKWRDENCSSQATVALDKDISNNNNYTNQITNDETLAKDNKVHKKTKETESKNLNQSNSKNVIENKILFGQKIDVKCALGKSQDGRKMDATEKAFHNKDKKSNKPKNNDNKDKPAKRYTKKSLQQNIEDVKNEQQVLHKKSKNFGKVGSNDLKPHCGTRDPAIMSKQNIVGNKLQVLPIQEAKNESRLDDKHRSSVSMNNESFIIKDINDRNVDIDLNPLMPEQSKIKGQINPKQTSGNTKTNVVKNAIIHPNENNIDNKKANNNNTVARSATPCTNKTVKTKSNDKSTPRISAPKKQVKSSEFQHNQGPHIQSFNDVKSDHQRNTQEPATNTQILSVEAERSQINTNEYELGKQSMSNKNLLKISCSPAHKYMPKQVISPTSSCQILPRLNPRLLRHQNSFLNVPLSKKSYKIVFPLDMPNKNLVSTQQPRNLNAPNILKRSHINGIQNEQGNIQGKTSHLVPRLKSGRYLIKIMDNIASDQQTNNTPETVLNKALPNQHHKVMQNQTTSQYPMPHKTHTTSNKYLTSNQPVQMMPPEQQINRYQKEHYKQNLKQHSNQELNHYNHDTFHTSLVNQPPQPNHDVPYTPNAQVNTDKVLSHNHNKPELLHPLPHDHVPSYTQNTHLNTGQALENNQFHANEYALYYNGNNQITTNQVPWPNEQTKLNEYEIHYNNNNTTVNTNLAPLPSHQQKRNFEEYYSKTINSTQSPGNQQPKNNAHELNSNNSTILNLDTNTVMHPPSLYDYDPQSMYDADCAFWNGVNYLGNEWQHGFPQPHEHLSTSASQPPTSGVSPHYLPQPIPTVPQYQPPPPSEHPLPSSKYPVSYQYPPPPFQKPPPASQNQPPSFQQPPPPHYPSLSSHHPSPYSQHKSTSFKKPSASVQYPSGVSQKSNPSAQHPPRVSPHPTSTVQHKPLVSPHPIPSAQHGPRVSPHPTLSAQHPPRVSPNPIPSAQHPLRVSPHPTRPAQHSSRDSPQPTPSAQHPSRISLHPAPSPQHPPHVSSHPAPSAQHPPGVSPHPAPSAQHTPRVSPHPTPSAQCPPRVSPHLTPSAQRPAPTLSAQHLPPFSQHPHLSSQHPPRDSQPLPLAPLPTNIPTFIQGSTILGSNNNGVVRTISLVTSASTDNFTESKETTLNKPLTDADKIAINTKSEILKKSKTMDTENPNLKRSMSDSQMLNGKPMPGPLAKVRKMAGVSCDLSSTPTALNKGYSPPILPIPTYEKTYEYIAQISNSKETTPSNRNIAMIDKNDGKKKTDFDEFEGVEKSEKSVKKISIDDYKNRTTKEKVENVIIKTEIKTESKFYDFDTDLGYDSDSTVKL